MYVNIIFLEKFLVNSISGCNGTDIKELDKEITDGLKISFVENMNEVLEKALA